MSAQDTGGGPEQAVAAAVLGHPAVARLDGGPFGSIASYLPGRRVLGVRLGAPGEPASVAVVLRYAPGAAPLARTADEIAALVRAALGPAAPEVVDVTVADVVAAPASAGG